MTVTNEANLFSNYDQNILIDTPTPPSFETTPANVNIELNKHGQWLWPSLVEGTYSLETINVIENELAPYISLIDAPGTTGGE